MRERKCCLRSDQSLDAPDLQNLGKIHFNENCFFIKSCSRVASVKRQINEKFGLRKQLNTTEN